MIYVEENTRWKNDEKCVGPSVGSLIFQLSRTGPNLPDLFAAWQNQSAATISEVVTSHPRADDETRGKSFGGEESVWN